MLDKIILAVFTAAIVTGSSLAYAEIQITTDKLGFHLDDVVRASITSDRADTELHVFVKDRNGSMMESLSVITDFDGNASVSFVINSKTWSLGTHEIIVGEHEPEVSYQFQVMGKTLQEALQEKQETKQLPSESESIAKRQNEQLKTQLQAILEENKQLKEENLDLKSQIKNLQSIIREQINVIMEWISSR